MFPHALTKWFFDLWDQLFFVLIANFSFTLVFLGLMIFVPAPNPLVWVLIAFIVYQPFTPFYTLWSKDLVVHGTAHWKDAWNNFKASWKLGLSLMGAWFLIVVGSLVGVPFYEAMNPWAGLGFGAVLFWLAFFLTGMGVFLPGLHGQVGGTLKSLIRKSFMLLLAHPALTLGLWFTSVLMVALSIVTAGFFPGMLGVQLWLQVGFRFLLSKYEYLEANPEFDKKKQKFPWKSALKEDLDRLGTRTLRGMIFPWKD